MKERWKECTLGDALTLQRGHDLPRNKMQDGDVPVAGSNGVIGYHNKFTTQAPGVTIGRSGNLGNAYYYKNNFWAHNTTLYVKQFNGNDELFIYYLLKTFDFKSYNVGSAVPTLNRNHVHPISILLPPLPEQKAIASVLSSLDDKIDLLHRQNKTLEAMAETLFRQWFVEEAKEDWEEVELGKITDINAGGDKPKVYSEIKTNECSVPIFSNGIVNEGLYGYTNSARINVESITISARGTIGYVSLRQEPYVPIVRLISIVPNESFISSKYLYLWAKSQDISGTGTTQQQLTVPDISRVKLTVPPLERMSKFTLLVNALFMKIKRNNEQISNLAIFRDTLLPKLISGEVRVAYKEAA